jgi:Protein of unknown function (DUF3703)
MHGRPVTQPTSEPNPSHPNQRRIRGVVVPTRSRPGGGPDVRAKRGGLREAWANERTAARAARRRADADGEWRHLERAHVLSQPMACAHVRTHVAMLGYGLRHHDRPEIVGQLLRLVLAAPGTWTGRYPVGNTGGANVSALTPMPIPDDLQAVLNGPVVAPGGRRHA